MIDQGDVDKARERVGGRVRYTPVLAAGPGTIFKLEYLQYTGSFKARGALNNVLSAYERGDVGDAGVVAASGGNAGLAVAWAAGQVGVPAEIYVPTTAPAVKVARLKAYGATVVQVGAVYGDAAREATLRAAESGAYQCHPYDQVPMVAGAGVVALELMEQAEADTVLVAVGGGGLVGGIAAAYEGSATKVVGVEPETSCCLHQALAAGEPVDVEVSGYAVDSLGAPRVGRIAFDVARRTGMGSVLVSDVAIREARLALWSDWRIVVEPGAAAAYAALTSGAYQPAEGERVAVVLCGANTDPGDLV